MSKSIKITVETTTEASETVGFFLEQATGSCATIFDVKDLDSCGWDYIEEGLREGYDGVVKVVGYCQPKDIDVVITQLTQNLDKLKQNLPNSGTLNVKTELFDEVDWLKEWQKNFKPIVLGKLCICPEWISPPESDTILKVVKLDSGIAFGTGYHETTSQCVLLMQQLNLSDKTVLDAGCGSGVLAFCALALGAKNAVLVDLDSQATAAAEENAKLNGLSDKCKIVCGDLVSNIDDVFDVCCANLTADILIRLAPDLPRVLKFGAYIVLSGILNNLLSKVENVFCDFGFVKISQSCKGEWSALLMRYLPDSEK